MKNLLISLICLLTFVGCASRKVVEYELKDKSLQMISSTIDEVIQINKPVLLTFEKNGVSTTQRGFLKKSSESKYEFEPRKLKDDKSQLTITIELSEIRKIAVIESEYSGSIVLTTIVSVPLVFVILLILGSR